MGVKFKIEEVSQNCFVFDDYCYNYKHIYYATLHYTICTTLHYTNYI